VGWESRGDVDLGTVRFRPNTADQAYPTASETEKLSTLQALCGWLGQNEDGFAVPLLCLDLSRWINALLYGAVAQLVERLLCK
jgi:hypothetical protein